MSTVRYVWPIICARHKKSVSHNAYNTGLYHLSASYSSFVLSPMPPPIPATPPATTPCKSSNATTSSFLRCTRKGMACSATHPGVTRHDHHFLQGAFGLVELLAAYGLTRCPPVALFDTPIDIFCSEDMEPLHHMLTSLLKRVGSLILLLD